MTKLRVLAIVVVGAGLALLFALAAGYWLYTGTPSYAIGQSYKAVMANDLQAFRKHVDVRGVARSAVDQIIANSVKEQQQQSAGEQLGSALGAGLAALMKPKLTEELELAIEKGVESGAWSKRIASSQTDWWEPILTPFMLVESVEKRGALALAMVTLQNGTSFEVRLRKVDGGWQVAELTNAAALAGRAKDLVDKP
jgi:hypothetical protein